MAVSAGSFLVKVNTGTDVSPVWTAVGSQRDAKLSRSMATIDVTSKDSNNWEESLPDVRSWSIDANAMYVPDDTAYEALETAWENQALVEIMWEEANGDTFTGNAYITDFPKSAPHKDAVTIDVTFKGCGELARTTSESGGLTDLSVDAGTLVPNFDTGTYTYVLEEATGVSTVTFTPTFGAGTTTVNGSEVESGNDIEISLGAAGSVTPVAIVNTETGKSPVSYAVYVSRAAA
jgi:TP901-1 family phage major tail protein